MSSNQNSKSHWLFKISINWTSKGFERRYFARQTLIDTISFLTTKCYFTIESLVFKQEIGIPMGTDLVPYWANFCQYFFESKYVQPLLSKGFLHAYKFHGTSRFIDDTCIIDDDGEFSSSCKHINLPQATRPKTWTSRGSYNMLGFGHNNWW